MNSKDKPFNETIDINVWLGLGYAFWVGMAVFVAWRLVK
jgi:hypothetical protein